MSESPASLPIDPPMEKYLAVKAVMMPRDTNPHGTIFGGVLLSYIDQAGAVGARRWVDLAGLPPRAFVTVAMNEVEFHQPVFIGDAVSFWTTAARLGRTSLTMHVEVTAERDRETIKLTEAMVTYVALNLDGPDRYPVPIRATDA